MGHVRKIIAVAGAAILAVMGSSAASAEAPPQDAVDDRRASATSARPTAWGPPAGAACSHGSSVSNCFAPKGDVFWIRDNKKDGHHVAVYWWGAWPGGGGDESQSCHNYHGKDAGWTRCDALGKKVPENEIITFWGLTKEGDKTISDGGWAPTTSSSTS